MKLFKALAMTLGMFGLMILIMWGVSYSILFAEILLAVFGMGIFALLTILFYESL